MKSYRKELWFNVPTRRAFINITPQVQECLNDESRIAEEIVLVNIGDSPSVLPQSEMDFQIACCKGV